MKNIFILLLSIVISSNSIIFAQETNIVPGNLLIMLDSDNSIQQIQKDIEFLNGAKTDLKMNRVLSQAMHIYLFDFNSSIVNSEQILKAVKTNSHVKIAQFNHTFQERISIPDDSLFGSMWDMRNTGQSGGTPMADIDAIAAWDITTGGLTTQGDTIVVAVIDGGFDLTHKDLNFWKNYGEIPNNGIDDDGDGYIDDFKGWNAGTNNDNIPSASHGTHVAGAIGAKGDNLIGVTGVNWNVKIMAISYGNASGNTGLEANAIASYSYVRDMRKIYNQTNGAKGAFVVSTNSSFGIDQPNGEPATYPLWCAMYDSLGAVGILSAAATANSNWNIDVLGDIPTACSSNWLVTVTNTTNTDVKNGSAGYGATMIDLGAPGTNTLSTLPGNNYGTMTGTSMATPHVAGAIALMYSVPCAKFIGDYKADPAGIALIVKDSLLHAVDKISDLSSANYPTVSGGRLNLFKSVKAIQNYCSGGDLTITQSDMPRIEDIAIEANDTLFTGITTESAGINQTWDFSNLVNHIQDTVSFVIPSALSGSTAYPTANLGNKSSKKPNSFINSSVSSFNILGVNGNFGDSIGFAAASIIPFVKRIAFPANYLSSYSGTYSMDLKYAYSNTSVDSAEISSTITYTSIIDGWGEITTPSFSNIPCLRQLYTEVRSQTIYKHFQGSWVQTGSATIDTTNTYDWWSHSKTFPIAEITTNGSGVTTGAKYLLFLHSPTVGINKEITETNSIIVYPNPAKDLIHITGISEVVYFVVTDITGKLVGNSLLKNVTNTYDIANFKNGMYFYQVFSLKGNVVGKGKFIVAK